jgi:hypothetical protein
MGRPGQRSDVVIAIFDYQPGVKLARPGGMSAAAGGDANAWGLMPNSRAKVTGIALSPNLWGDKPQPHNGQHVFFLLDGCKDAGKGVGRGFFVEMLRSELRQVRSTLEAYAASAEITGLEEASACGLGMSNQGAWNLLLRVTSRAGVATYKIDRWD